MSILKDIIKINNTTNELYEIDPSKNEIKVHKKLEEEHQMLSKFKNLRI